MKKNKKNKAFTLIELLGVIVILAVIAVIATPIIFSMVNKARRNAFKASAQALADAAGNYIAEEEALGREIEWRTNSITNEKYISFNLSNEEEASKLNVRGKRPSKGRVEITSKGQTFVVAIERDLCAKKNYNESAVNILSLNSDDICLLTDNSAELSSDQASDILSTVTNLVNRVETLEAKNTALESQVETLQSENTTLKNYFSGTVTSVFQNNSVQVGKNASGSIQPSVNLYQNGVQRASFILGTNGDALLSPRNSSGDWNKGRISILGDNIDIGKSSATVNLIGTVKINNTDINTTYSKKPVSVYAHNTITTSTSLSYTGTSVTIPANCFYSLTFKAVFNNSKPQLIGVSTSSSTYREIVSNAAGQHFASVSYSNKTGSSAETFYVWAQYPSANQNNIGITGFYIPQ